MSGSSPEPVAIGLSLAILGVSWLVMVRVCRVHALTRPTVLGVGYLGLLGTLYAPALYFLFDPRMRRAEPLFWGCTLALLTMALGGAYANAVTWFDRREIARYFDAASNTPASRRDRIFVFGWGVLCVLLLLNYVREVRVYPLYLLLTGGVTTEAVNAMRRDVLGPDMGSSLWYVYGLARVALMPFLFCLVWATWRSMRGVPARLACVLFVATVLVFNSWSGAKTPVAMLFAVAFALSLMLGNRVTRIIRSATGALRTRRGRTWLFFIATAVVAVGYPIFIFKFKAFGQDKELIDILVFGVLRRILFSPAYLAHYAFELFPEQIDFTYFRDVGKLAALFGLEYVDLSKIVAEAQGTPDSAAPPPAVGTFYAQLGWPWLLGGFFLAGALLQFIQVWLIRNFPRGPIVLAANALLCWGAFRLSMTSLHTVLLTEAIVPTALLLVAWRGLRRARLLPRPVGSAPTRPASSPVAG